MVDADATVVEGVLQRIAIRIYFCREGAAYTSLLPFEVA
jgi:hypothetical protein